jgi:adenylate cyclase
MLRPRVGKAKLTLSGVVPQPKVIDLVGEVVVGRSMKAQVQIDGDLVSRQHARFFESDGRWHVEDLGSRNGTLLNGNRVTTATLKHGDVVMIGYGRLDFEEEHPESSSFEVSIVEGPALGIESAVLAAADDEDNTGATLALSYKDLVLVNQRITTIVRVGQRIANLLDRDELLREVMETLFDLFPQADRGCVVLKDESDMFRLATTYQRQGMVATTTVVNLSTSLIDLVRRERKAVLSADTLHDKRFEDRESIVGNAGRSIMVAPLLRDDEFLGVIYLDTETLARPFTGNDLNMLQGVAGPVSLSLKNAELVGRIENEARMRTSLSRYLSPDVVQQIEAGALKPNLGGSQLEGTVMFSDIVGFTAMSEKLAPSDVVDRLNRYFTQMLEAIFGWGGTVDKFGGDAILAVWGAPVPSTDHAVNAVGGSLEMHARLFGLNQALEEAGETRIRMAVGLNSGRFVAGNIGGAERMEWTVIGDTVNLAQRVEAQGFHGCVLVSEPTFSQLPGAGAYSFPPVLVKNRTVPVRIHSVRVAKTSRGIVASIRGELRLSTGPAHAILVRVGTTKEGRRKVTIHAAGNAKIGETVEFAAILPENPIEMTLRGRVVSGSPLLECKTARSLDVEVESAHMELERLLSLGGSAESPVSLDKIER